MSDLALGAIAFEHTHDVVLAIDGAGRIVRANAAVEAVLDSRPTRCWASACGRQCSQARRHRNVAAMQRRRRWR
ncbi:MAG: hypothetical protein KIT58_07385 [Planctomycetota bacterium]|nr:hypothetical protein [Planctomycetota bacterium]